MAPKHCPKDVLLSEAKACSRESLEKIIETHFDGNHEAAWVYSSPKSGDTLSIVAARNGNLDLLQYVKECTANEEKLRTYLEQSNRTGKRPIHEAAQNGHENIIGFLLDEGVDINSMKQQDWTPLMLSCTKTDARAVRCLVKCGADVSVRNKDGWNCFHIATREGDVGILTLLLDKEPTLWDTRSKNGRTPLHTAALHGRSEAIDEVLLSGRCGYRADEKDSCGSTPMMESCRAGHVHIMKSLLTRNKANIRKRDNLSRTLLHIAAEAGENDSIDFIISHHLSENSSLDGSDINTRTSHGCTPVYLAAREGHHRTVQALVELDGIDVNVPDANGRTALHMAVIKRSTSTITILLANGAQDVRDRSGKYAKDYATGELRKAFLT